MWKIFTTKPRITHILKSGTRALALSLALILVACSTSKPKPPPQPSYLRVVTLNTKVAMPEIPEFRSGGEGITAALNAMGAKIGNSRVEELQALMKRGDVDIQQLVLDSVRSELEKSGAPIHIVEHDGEADLQLSIDTYGLDKGLEWSVVPSIDLRVSLVRADGNIIWDDHEYIDRRHEFRSEIKTNTFSAYRENPAQLKADYAANIAWVVHEVIEGLKEDHASGDIGN